MRVKAAHFPLLLFLACAFASAAAAADLNEELLAAVRKSDVAAVRALLEKGADANAKYRYERTVLSFAADRGNLEVVKLLLARGANTNVKDTFYGMTPLDAALSKAHVEVATALLDAGSPGRESALRFAAQRGNMALLDTVLAQGKLPQPALDAALAAAVRAKKDEAAEALKKAGANPPPPADFEVDAATLATYAGTYRSDQGEFTFVLKDGKLVGGPGGQMHTLGAIDKVTFRPMSVDGVTLKFESEAGKVTALTVTQGGRPMTFKRVEAK